MIIKNNLFSENPEPECVYFSRFAQATHTTETHVHLLLKGQDIKRLSQYSEKIMHIPHLELKLIRDYKLLNVNSLSKLTNLKSLTLEGIPFEKLDALCPHLTHLEQLILGDNSLTSLPESFKNLHQLRQLDIQENLFTAFPNIIFNLTKLEKLNIYSNAFKEIPDGIGALTQLTDLCLSSCQIEQLSEAIGQLKQLKTLDLSENYIDCLPKSITALKKLESVNLSSNSLGIDDICSFLVELPQLKVLYLKSLGLKYLPDAFYRLKNLNCIDLSDNFLDLNVFFRAAHSVKNPTQIQLYSLRVEELAEHPILLITEIPDAIGDFTHLKSFSIADAQDIIKISPKIVQLTQLETLYFYSLKALATFPDVFDQLPHLHTLSIINCKKLKYYPPSIYKSKSIKALHVIENNCTHNQLCLEQMTQLSSLTLHMTQPADVEPIVALINLESLTIKSYDESIDLPVLHHLTHFKNIIFERESKLNIAQALQQLPYLERVEIKGEIPIENWVFPPTIRALHLNDLSVSPTTLLHWVETLPHLETLAIARFSDDLIPQKITLLNQLKHFFIKPYVSYRTQSLEWVLWERPKSATAETIYWMERDLPPTEAAVHRVQDLQLPTEQHKMLAFGLFSGITRLLNTGLENPFAQLETLKNSIFYIMGKPSWQTSSLLKADLQTFGVKTTPHWTLATHILICPQSHDDLLWKAILTSDKKLVLEDFLKHKMLEMNTPFLINAATESEDSEALQNITQLLCSKQEDNTALILEIITAGGAPRRLLSYLTAIHLKHPVKSIQKKAKLLFQKYASLDLQTHIEGALNAQSEEDDYSYYEESYLYVHPDIDLFDAIAAEKMIEFHYKKDAPLNLLSCYNDDWKAANTGLKRMPFLTRIRFHNVQNFDFQSFIHLIQDLSIEELELLDLHETIDLTPLWAMKTLKRLHLSTRNQGMSLRLPPVLAAPLDSLNLQGFKLLDTEHINVCLSQIKDIQIRQLGYEHELPF